jgi:hypothetical protein
MSRSVSGALRTGITAWALTLGLGTTGLVVLARSSDEPAVPATPESVAGPAPYDLPAPSQFPVTDAAPRPDEPPAPSTPDRVARGAPHASQAPSQFPVTDRAPRPLAPKLSQGVVLTADSATLTAPVPPPRASTATRAVASFAGTAAPGLRIWLSAERSSGEDLHFCWVQTKGPVVELAQTDSARVPVLVPGNATELEFALVVSGKEGVDRTTLKVPLLLHARPVIPSGLVADAGDDQIAIVGHQVTLNGIRSTPRENAAYRWIQIDGPKIRARVEEAWICTFVPEEPGVYKFLLVVGTGGAISEPSVVRVLVGGSLPAELVPESSRPDPIEGLAREGLAAVGGNPQLGVRLGGAFDSVAQRMALYTSYNDVFSEISRRLEVLIPTDPDECVRWDKHMIDPLADRIVRVMQSEGLNLHRSEAESRPLTENQKNRLSALFRSAARGFQGGVDRVADPSAPQVGVAPSLPPR